ncbi:hypothetical protein KAFR_0B00430 [Kazachstania africana CBS 2517]|uniref:Uncharacterized protein n=1 Tax=Kazachstania africana (strain ATCC 22294 / BCRC 22015 / CBS 2517 / CECT 1963 / NBRC 1671 / NRRL Y-8276) TaxID=1071382 RepID=H2APP3_KAZAF|nr:hypothetical protein KAFR_0B00430 [Kazachstania africana CBS 2517]CCF56343.1 hypothetical protein KAFR_0B00430 [Kazachstania africana CBS 2517]
MIARRSSDLDSFLKRVETLDNKKNQQTSPRVRQPSAESKYSESDLQKASELLDDDSLAYRSAYNYERTFSPKKPSYSISDFALENNVSSDSEAYIVSKEDYMLLNKLKTQNQVAALPSRGQPRERHSSISSSPRHQKDDVYEKRFNKIMSKKRDPNPPQLPTRPGTSEDIEKKHFVIKDRKRNSIYASVPIIDDNSRESSIIFDDDSDILASPTGKGMSSLNVNLGYQRKLPHDDTLSQPILQNLIKKEPPLVSRATKPELKPQSEIKSKPEPPVSRKPIDIKSMSFLTSLDKNKLSISHTHDGSPKKVTNIHVDYIDSIQLKENISLPSKENLQSNLETKIVPKSESFINSALKTKKSAAKVLDKPLLPSKPKNLKISGKLNADKEKDTQFDEKTANEVEKRKPLVPAKKKFDPSLFGSIKQNNEPISLVKLRPVGQTNERPNLDDDAKLLIQNRQKLNRPPEVPKRKPTIPEALLKIDKLNKTDISLNMKKEEDVPEALLKKKHLQKSKTAPVIPARKVSLNEVVKKSQILGKQEAKIVASLGDDNDTAANKLEAVLMAHRLRSRNTIGTSTLKTMSSSEDNSLFSRDSSINTSKSEVSTVGQPKPLVHVTKARARGPKRKLPTKF